MGREASSGVKIAAFAVALAAAFGVAYGAGAAVDPVVVVETGPGADGGPGGRSGAGVDEPGHETGRTH
ncbi:hypothetical protein [Streptomyces sp. SP18CS02]|uniref:hypothetical protein n=1 Tax=Streptomyces sp. SP18CS02 TaxID=3002531 RepID=UPI002E76D8AD|nr:hypothetical protein [Streptomyces sp. SP18CS02]MEE1755674.1 hypothetical protein [Streptomyces sp. SP18CS02]